MVNFTILTKDRPAQLDLMLRSFAAIGWPVGGFKCLWRASSDFYRAGYDKLWRLHDVPRLEESPGQFKRDFLSLQDWTKELTSVITDDCVVQRPFAETDPEFRRLVNDNRIAALSLVLGHNVHWLYEQNREISMPEFSPDMRWVWHDQDKCYNYPMLILGNMWRTADMRPKLEGLNYTEAWNLETELVHNPVNRPMMNCYGMSRIVETPINNVSGVENKRGCFGTQVLNTLWMDGYRLKTPKIIENNAPHFEYTFEVERDDRVVVPG